MNIQVINKVVIQIITLLDYYKLGNRFINNHSGDVVGPLVKFTNATVLYKSLWHTLLISYKF